MTYNIKDESARITVQLPLSEHNSIYDTRIQVSTFESDNPDFYRDPRRYTLKLSPAPDPDERSTHSISVEISGAFDVINDMLVRALRALDAAERIAKSGDTTYHTHTEPVVRPPEPEVKPIESPA